MRFKNRRRFTPLIAKDEEKAEPCRTAPEEESNVRMREF